MILWVILFFLIIGISFILAFRSMKDYQEIPQKSKVEYGLFLIRQTEGFDANTLNSIGSLILNEGLVISIERLFKGTQSALTIFGPKNIMNNLSEGLNLLELEDYTEALDADNISIWEVGAKSGQSLRLDSPNNIFLNVPQLGSEDQFFWQVVLGVRRGGDLTFQTQIRAAIYSRDPLRRKILIPLFQNLTFGELTKVPKPYSSEQMMHFYHLRSLSQDSNGPVLSSEGALRLLKV